MNYSDKLKDPRWQMKRLRVMERDGFACQCCFDQASTLNVHHLCYVQGYDPWEYDDKDLITLCEDCHEKVSKLIKLTKEELPRIYDLGVLLPLSNIILNAQNMIPPDMDLLEQTMVLIFSNDERVKKSFVSFIETFDNYTKNKTI